MTITGDERVAVLTDQAANALIAARSSLSLAAGSAEEVDGVLRRTEADIEELSGEARRVRFAEEPGPHLRSAQWLADGIEQRIRAGRRGLEEVGDQLDEGARALNAGRQFLAELEQAHHQRGGATENLQERLQGLEFAVSEARTGVEEAAGRLAAAQRNIEPLLYSSSHVEDRDRTAAAVNTVGANVSNDVLAVRQRLTGLRDDLEHTQPRVTQAAQQGVDLATAARAAMNPTPAAGQRVLSGPAEVDLRRRQGSAVPGPGQER